MSNPEKSNQGRSSRASGGADGCGLPLVAVGERHPSLLQGWAPEREQEPAAHVLAFREPARAALDVLGLLVNALGAGVGAPGRPGVDHERLYLPDAAGRPGHLLDAAAHGLAGTAGGRLAALAGVGEVGGGPPAGQPQQQAGSAQPVYVDNKLVISICRHST